MAVRDQFAVEPPILHFVGVLSRKKRFPHSQSDLPTGREMGSAPSTVLSLWCISFHSWSFMHVCKGLEGWTYWFFQHAHLWQCYALLIRWQGCMHLVRHHVASRSWYFHEISSRSCWASVARPESALLRGTRCLFVAEHFGSAMTAAWRSRNGN